MYFLIKKMRKQQTEELIFQSYFISLNDIQNEKYISNLNYIYFTLNK
jgi:hypothetical protein